MTAHNSAVALREAGRDGGLGAALDATAVDAADAADRHDPRDLLWARLGASERLRDLTLRRLRGRTSGDGPLLRHTLLRAQLAEAFTDHLEVVTEAEAADASGGTDARVLARLHRAVTETDRLLLRCYGAEGFLAGSPGEDALYGERLANRSVAVYGPANATGRPAPPGVERQPATPVDALRGLAREWGRELATYAAQVDTDPGCAGDLVALAGPAWLATAGIPPQRGGRAVRVEQRDVDGTTAVDRVVILEELARGDVGALLASPGPSMSGVLIEHLADPDQQKRYDDRMLESPTWTCFALTEPEHGSDATAMDSRVDSAQDGLAITGTKRFVGNAVRAQWAVVFARRSAGPLGIGAYLVDTTTVGWAATPLSTLGLRAAQLGEIELDQLAVDPDDELGRWRRPTRRGLRAAVDVFDRLRPGVAAMALGVAECAIDLLEDSTAAPADIRDSIRRWRREIGVVRTLALDAAATVDADGPGSLASLAKARACRLAERITLDVAEALGPGARDRYPTLERTILAARGIEFMEGTRNIQLLNGFRGLDTGRLGGPTGGQPSVSGGSALDQRRA